MSFITGRIWRQSGCSLKIQQEYPCLNTLNSRPAPCSHLVHLGTSHAYISMLRASSTKLSSSRNSAAIQKRLATTRYYFSAPCTHAYFIFAYLKSAWRYQMSFITGRIWRQSGCSLKIQQEYPCLNTLNSRPAPCSHLVHLGTSHAYISMLRASSTKLSSSRNSAAIQQRLATTRYYFSAPCTHAYFIFAYLKSAWRYQMSFITGRIWRQSGCSLKIQQEYPCLNTLNSRPAPCSHLVHLGTSHAYISMLRASSTKLSSSRNSAAIQQRLATTHYFSAPCTHAYFIFAYLKSA